MPVALINVTVTCRTNEHKPHLLVPHKLTGKHSRKDEGDCCLDVQFNIFGDAGVTDGDVLCGLRLGVPTAAVPHRRIIRP